MKKHQLLTSLTLLCAAFSFGTANAQSFMQSKASVAAACTIAAPNVEYGDISLTALQYYRKDFNIQVKCSNAMPYRVTSNETHAKRYMEGAQSGTSTALWYALRYVSGSTEYSFGSGASYSFTGIGTGNLENHSMRTLLYADSLPTPDNYSASTTLNVIF